MAAGYTICHGDFLGFWWNKLHCQNISQNLLKCICHWEALWKLPGKPEDLAASREQGKLVLNLKFRLKKSSRFNHCGCNPIYHLHSICQKISIINVLHFGTIEWIVYHRINRIQGDCEIKHLPALVCSSGFYVYLKCNLFLVPSGCKIESKNAD